MSGYFPPVLSEGVPLVPKKNGRVASGSRSAGSRHLTAWSFLMVGVKPSSGESTEGSFSSSNPALACCHCSQMRALTSAM